MLREDNQVYSIKKILEDTLNESYKIRCDKIIKKCAILMIDKY